MKINNNQSSRKIKSRDAFKLLGNENQIILFGQTYFHQTKKKSKISSNLMKQNRI